MERLSYECAFHPRISLLAHALTLRDGRPNIDALEHLWCVMQRETYLYVVAREKNVVRVDFGRDPDPPAPRFPGASGLREFNDESTSETGNVADAILNSAAAKYGLLAGRGAVNAPPDGQRGACRIGSGSIAA
jgi:hypothetical protein